MTSTHNYRPPGLTAVVLAVFIAVAAMLVAFGTTATGVLAQSTETVRVISSNVVSEFPEGMLFKLELES